MTCVVGIAHNGSVHLGADCQGSNGWTQTDRLDGKVFAKGPMVMGFTSSYRMGQLLRYKLELPEHRDNVDTFEYMVAHFVESVRQCLKDGGFAKVENSVDSGGIFLVGYRGRLFCIESDFQVGERSDGFDAVGCGESFALGALHVTKGAPRNRIHSALQAAARFSNGVGERIEYVIGGKGL